MVTAKERRVVLWMALAIVLAASIPYLAGFARENTGWVYTGFIFGVEDGNSYIAKMLSGAAGSWLFRTPYTAYPQNGFLAFLPYILLGKLAAPPAVHMQLTALFHLFRLASGILMVLATYDFVALFISRPERRRLATALAVLGGGLGWLTLLGIKGLWQNNLPLEFYSPESFGFLALYGIPHLALGRALLLWGLRAYILPQPGGFTLRRSFKGGLLWLVLSLMQPLTVLVGWAIMGAQLGVQGLLRWREARSLRIAIQGDWLGQLKKAVVFALVSCPLVIYTAFSFLTDPFLKGWGEQNIILSPPPLDYLLAYFLLPLSILGLIRLLRTSSTDARSVGAYLLLGWLLLFPLLAYAPYNLQRRLPEGIWTAISLLAVYALDYLPVVWQRWLRPVLWSSFLPSLVLLLGGVMSVWNPAAPQFRPALEVQAFEELAGMVHPGDVVLADYPTSNALPAWTPVHTLVGHGPESIHLKQVQPRVDAFFSSQAGDAERRALIDEFSVRYVIGSPQETVTAYANLDALPYLKRLYDTGGYRIYVVEREN